jgi:5-methylcytosine-specific restriction endonuclease McrA
MSQRHKDPEYLKNRGVVLREQPICTVCNRQPSTQVDHIIPLDAGGGHDPSNLRGICARCNNTLGHNYVNQRNQLRQTVRAEAMRQNGIKDTTNETKHKKPKPFFYEQKLLTRLLRWSAGG